MKVLPLSLSILFLSAVQSHAVQINDSSTTSTKNSRDTLKSVQLSDTLQMGTRKAEFDNYISKVDFIKAVDFQNSNVTFSFTHNYQNGKSDQIQKVTLPTASASQIGLVAPDLYKRWQKAITNVRWSGDQMVFTDHDGSSTSLKAVKDLSFLNPGSTGVGGQGAVINLSLVKSGGSIKVNANNCDCGIESVTRNGLTLTFRDIHNRTTTQTVLEKVTVANPSGTGAITSVSASPDGSGYKLTSVNCDCGIQTVRGGGGKITFTDVRGGSTSQDVLESISVNGPSGGSKEAGYGITSISGTASGGRLTITASRCHGHCNHCTHCEHCSYNTNCNRVCNCHCECQCNCQSSDNG